jgi:SEC-C motif-containing protein
MLSATPQPKWLGLEIKAYFVKGNSATVEFVASFCVEHREQRMHELSRFRHEAGRWYYLDGVVD